MTLLAPRVNDFKKNNWPFLNIKKKKKLSWLETCFRPIFNLSIYGLLLYIYRTHQRKLNFFENKQTFGHLFWTFSIKTTKTIYFVLHYTNKLLEATWCSRGTINLTNSWKFKAKDTVSSECLWNFFSFIMGDAHKSSIIMWFSHSNLFLISKWFTKEEGCNPCTR